MATRIVHNIATGEIQEIEIDNTWIIANRPKNVLISIPLSAYLVGQSAIISIQLVTPHLVDNSQNPLTDNLSIEMQFGDLIQTVALVNGAFSDTINFVLAGTYRFLCLSHPSNTVEVIVT